MEKPLKLTFLVAIMPKLMLVFIPDIKTPQFFSWQIRWGTEST